MNRLNQYQAFSLIELMVVIAIVGVLAAISLPMYNASVARTIISNGIKSAEPLLQEFKDAANLKPNAGPAYGSAYSSNDTWPPNQFMVDGSLQTVYTNKSVTSYGPYISNIGYGTNKSGNSGDGLGGGFTIRIPNTSGYQPATYPYFEVQIGYRWVNGTLVRACGSSSGSFGTFPIPPADLLPKNCQCSYVSWWASAGDYNGFGGCPNAF